VGGSHSSPLHHVCVAVRPNVTSTVIVLRQRQKAPVETSGTIKIILHGTAKLRLRCASTPGARSTVRPLHSRSLIEAPTLQLCTQLLLWTNCPRELARNLQNTC
jgi:hypothetical protein